ncbi:hypothetical protein Dimus_012906 [Dionaea muscipula]
MEYVNISRKCGKNPEYTEPLEITRRFANDDTIMKARRVKSVEMKPSQRVPLVIKREKNLRNTISLKTPSSPCVSLPRENGIWWIGSGENRRRDDNGDAQEVEREDEDEGNKDDFGGRR